MTQTTDALTDIRTQLTDLELALREIHLDSAADVCMSASLEIQRLKAALAEAEGKVAAVSEKASAVVEGFAAAMPSIDNCVKVSTIHGVPYTGPSLGKQIDDLDLALNNIPAAATALMERVNAETRRTDENLQRSIKLAEDWSAAVTRAEAAEARARTPGTVEVCSRSPVTGCPDYAGRHNRDMSDCKVFGCPIRSKEGV